MELALVVEAADGTDRLLAVEVGESAPVADLVAALATPAGVGPSIPAWLDRTGQQLGSGDVASLGLRDGDRIRFGADRGRTADASTAPTTHELLVVGGHATGARVALVPGRHIVGRDETSATVVVADPSLSRRHFGLDVSGERVEVVDLGSTNGTVLDGELLDGPRRLSPGSIIEAGACLLTVERVDADTSGSYRYERGRLVFNRPPRLARPHEAPTFELPVAPSPPEGARLPIAASVVPVVVGLLMFLLLGNTTFLLFMALGPVMALFSWWDDRRSGSGRLRTDVIEFRRRLAELAPQVEDAHHAARTARRERQPSPAHVVGLAQRTSAQLWERRGGDDDFLAVRVGVADQPSAVAVVVPPGGDETLRAEAAALRERHAVDIDVPVEVPLHPGAVLGIAGRTDTAAGLARWLLVQAAALHSPSDVTFVAFLRPGSADDWVALLPHTATLVPGGRSVADGRDAALRLVAALEATLAERRTGATLGGLGQPPPLPHLLVFVEGPEAVEPAALARIVEAGRGLGLSLVVRAPSTAELPGACDLVVSADAGHGAGTVTDLHRGTTVANVVVDELGVDTARAAASALAPLRDAAASSSAAVPDRVRLLELLGTGEPTSKWVASRWADGARKAIVGVSATGVVTLDLRHDGPHVLVAGTTGAGKSELLQTWVASLAVTVPPERLSLLLVDYKGGAAFKDCVSLPHTVGFVTDLDPHLARRALDSLEAELARREVLLRDAGAKDLVEIETRDPAHAPPDLLIVIDEFAFLKKEVPEFVAGVVDIAQRGRSLGVHLILATQRPAGVIDDQIRANTNLRIALRMGDEHDSHDVIGTPDAARLSRTTPGRALVRTGHAELATVQAAYVGGGGEQSGPLVRVVPLLGRLDDAGRSPAPRRPDGATDLQRLVGGARDAFAATGRPPPRRPWLPPLPPLVPLSTLPPSPPTDAAAAVLGLADEPRRQRQHPDVVDLSADGHLLVYGTSGSGKTTTLRTIAAGLAARHAPVDLHLYALDFATGALRGLEALPQCGGVVTGDDPERVERLFAVLASTIRDRREILGRSGAGSLVEHRAATSPADRLAVPHVVVLLDGYEGFVATYSAVDHGALVDRLTSLVGDGRGVGVHFVITASRRSGVPTPLASAVARRLVLRMADPDEYLWLDVPQARETVLPAGRGYTVGGREVQLAVVGDDPSGHGQARALDALGGDLRRRHPDAAVPSIQALPDDVPRSALPPASADRRIVPVGLDSATQGPAAADLSDLPILLVAGPDRSGRSTALVTVARGLFDADPGLPGYLLAPRRSPLLDEPRWQAVARSPEDALGVLARIADAAVESASPALLVVDDGDELAEGLAAPALERVVRLARDGRVIVLVAAQTHVLHRTYGGWLSDVRKAKTGILLAPDPDVDGDVLGARLPRRATHSFPPGRGYLVQRGAPSLVQVAR